MDPKEPRKEASRCPVLLIGSFQRGIREGVDAENDDRSKVLQPMEGAEQGAVVWVGGRVGPVWSIRLCGLTPGEIVTVTRFVPHLQDCRHQMQPLNDSKSPKSPTAAP